MKKFLIGLPIILLGLFLLLLPGLIFDKIGFIVEEAIILIGGLGFFSYVIGESVLEKIRKRK